MSIIYFLMSISSMSHVDFKKWPCRPVEFKGQGPSYYPGGRIQFYIMYVSSTICGSIKDNKIIDFKDHVVVTEFARTLPKPATIKDRRPLGQCSRPWCMWFSSFCGISKQDH